MCGRAQSQIVLIMISPLECASEMSVAAIRSEASSYQGVYTQDGSTINGKPVYRSNAGNYITFGPSSTVKWSIGSWKGGSNGIYSLVSLEYI